MTKMICTDSSGIDYEAYINLDQLCFIEPMSAIYPNLVQKADWAVFVFSNGERLFAKPENNIFNKETA
jgi:hypothetical protein